MGGSDEKPNSGSLLDLKDGTAGGNSQKGLMLPRVKITTTAPTLGKLAHSLGTIGIWGEAEHIGLTVYNVNVADACIGGADEGVYIWDGSQWTAIFSKAPTSTLPIQSTDLYSGANSYILEPNGEKIEIPVERVQNMDRLCRKYTYWFMDRHWGATNNSPSTAHGLYYQWGRPTPIQKFGTVAATTSNSGTAENINLTTALQTPQFITLVSSNSHDWYSKTSSLWDSRWGNQDAVGSENATKSPFDPCPYGWRVPSDKEGMSPWHCLTTPSGQAFNNGWLFNDVGRSIGYYAASGYRSNGNGSLGDIGTAAYIWTASPGSLMSHFLYFSSTTVDPQFSYNKANGMTVRCIQE